MYSIYFDGACSPNPGECSYGVSLQRDGIEIDTASQHIGKGTNNVAEYHAIIAAIQMALFHKLESCEIVGDSLLVINQIKGTWRINDSNLKILCEIARALLSKSNFTIRHVKRQLNARADELARAHNS